MSILKFCGTAPSYHILKILILMGSNCVCLRTHTDHITLSCDWKKKKSLVTSAWTTPVWSSTMSFYFSSEGKMIFQSVFVLVSMTALSCGSLKAVCRPSEEQNSVLCNSSLPLTPTQQTWSPTGRLDCESSSSLLTIVLFFLPLALSLFLSFSSCQQLFLRSPFASQGLCRWKLPACSRAF